MSNGEYFDLNMLFSSIKPVLKVNQSQFHVRGKPIEMGKIYDEFNLMKISL